MAYDADKIAAIVAAQASALPSPEPFGSADAITPEAGFTVGEWTQGYVIGPIAVLQFQFTHNAAMALVKGESVALGELAPALQPPGEGDGNDNLWGALDPIGYGYAGPNGDMSAGVSGEFQIDSEGAIEFVPHDDLAAVANLRFRSQTIIAALRKSFSADVV